MGFEHRYYAPIGLTRVAPARRLGHVLSLCRRSRNLTQQDLGERLSYGASAQKEVCQWETGRVLPAPYTIDNIAHAIGLPPEDTWYLKGLAGYIPPRADPLADVIARGVELARDEMRQIPHPANICDPHWNVLAWNEPMNVLTGAAQIRERSILHVIFDPPTDVFTFYDWEIFAHRQVSAFRKETWDRRHEPWYMALIDSLALYPSFPDIWELPPLPQDPLIHHLDFDLLHHHLGRLAFRANARLAFGSFPYFQLIEFEPRDDHTRRCFALRLSS